MRSLQTYILRLFIDEESPRRLAGKLVAFGEQKTLIFTDELSLLEALRSLQREATARLKSDAEKNR